MPMVKVGDIVTLNLRGHLLDLNLRGHLLDGKTGKVTKVEYLPGKQKVEAEIEINGSVAGYYIFELPLPPMKLKWRM